ncbi:MAG: SH3 domain-containing protein [Treponema sp.]|jgi:hypothetical protein|nr:SH3 domain-containing protein [Treponema sp.]
MKKFAFSLVLTFLAVSLFAQNTASYEKLLRGDLSDFAGYWVNGENERIYLRPNGTTYFQGQEAGNFGKSTAGTYGWNISLDDEPGFFVMILPVGVDGFYDVKTDTTKVRLAAGHDVPGSAEGYYYRESQFPATHSTTENIKLRTGQDLSSATIKVLAKGAKVLLYKSGNEATIDGISARWVYVYTIDGFKGWCFSGYLQDTRNQ